jgi:hypothetical protein
MPRVPTIFCILLATLFVGAGRAGALEPSSDIVSGNYNSTTNDFDSVQVINDVVGASVFYQAGYFGQRTVIANVEAGLVWGGHDVFDRSSLGLSDAVALSYSAARDPVTAPDLGDIDYHATAVGNVLAGTGDMGDGNLSALGAGMAPLAVLWSGAIATTFDRSEENLGSFTISNESFLEPYRAFFTGSLGSKPDVINSSWGFQDSVRKSSENRILDALASSNPSVTFVRSAGNSGPTTAPGVGYNGITVGSLGGGTDPQPFLRPSTFSSSKAGDYYDPITGTTLTGVRAAVDIAAPGEDFALAAYLGASGTLKDLTEIHSAATDQFFVNQSGTSFAAPVVAGGVALLKDVSYAGFYLVGQPEARDSRVIKSILQAGATETVGWNNGQHDVDGIITTTQALDFATGAGALDLEESVNIYVGGTTDVAGMGGGAISSLGWDFGAVTDGSANDYLFDLSFDGPIDLTVSLNWFVSEIFDEQSELLSYGSFVDLNLSIWTVVAGVFADEIASSESLYGNSEFLRLQLVAGSYGLRVSFDGKLYDFTGTHNSETYGLAWATHTAPVPEPWQWSVGMGLALFLIVTVRRRAKVCIE